MTGRERLTAILAGDVPDQVALYEHFWGETLRDAWLPQGFPAGQSPEQFFDYDLTSIGWDVDTRPFRRDAELLEEDDELRLTRDGFGATLRQWKHKSGTPEHIAYDCVSPRVWRERYREPLLTLDLARIDREGLPQRLAAARNGHRFAVYGNMFCFELLRAILGNVCMLESFLLEPAWIHDFCRVYTDFYCRHYDWIFGEIGKPDGMFIYEDLGFANGPFMSPALYRELVMPYHRELVGFFHDHGLPAILHTCGDVRQLFDDIVDTGWDCLQPMEAKVGNHVLAYADRVRERGLKLGFMGNIDVTVLASNDRERIRAEIEHKVKGLVERGVGYCFHSDHSIPPSVDLATYTCAVEVMRQVGRYA